MSAQNNNTSSSTQNDPPPPYAEPGTINWSTMIPHLTPENISPKVFHALQVMTQMLMEAYFVENQVDQPNDGNLRWANIYWWFMVVFSESIIINTNDSLMKRLSKSDCYPRNVH
jgi:hypothetical protein